MGCNTQTFNIGIRNILLGQDRAQKFCVFTKADVSGSLNNKYFVFHEPVTQAKHVVYFSINSLGVDPAIPNSTSHVVALPTNASAIAVATGVAAVLNALTTIFAGAVAMGNEVECEFAELGYAYEARDALAVPSRTRFNIVVGTFGSIQKDLGPTNGDITATFEELTREITSPQTGQYVLGEIRQGATVSLSFELKDSSKDSIRRNINFYGGTIVTDDAASEVISGYGTSNLFKSTDDVADQLILRPTEKAADLDPSEDFTFHKTKLKLGEVVFSAENELVLPIEAVTYLDTTKSRFANLFSYGNGGALPNES